MKAKQIIDACGGIRELTAMVLPYKTARALAALRKALQEELDAIVSNENALAESLGGKRKGNAYAFEDAAAREKFAAEVEKMQEEDDETITLPRVDLSGQTAQMRISADAITALDGIVIFEREAKEGKE